MVQVIVAAFGAVIVHATEPAGLKVEEPLTITLRVSVTPRAGGEAVMAPIVAGLWEMTIVIGGVELMAV